MSVYPWQQEIWRSAQQLIKADRLPHALLLSGPAGLGKLDFARLLAQFLLCENPTTEHACGHCQGCHLFAAGTHPDFQAIQPEEEGKELTIGQIRELLSWQTLTPQYGRARVVIIEPADRMNQNAANALLKTLEEPAQNALILLVTAHSASLLPTIRSRCQQLSFAIPSRDISLPWLAEQLTDKALAELTLAISDGAPLRAASLARSGGLELRTDLFADFEGFLQGKTEPVLLASQWLKLPLIEAFSTLHGWHVDMARLKIDVNTTQLNNPDLRKRLQVLSEQVDLTHLLQRQVQLQEAMKRMRGHPNIQLLLEEMLLSWSSANEKLARRATQMR